MTSGQLYILIATVTLLLHVLTISVHFDLETFLESACLTLVSPCHVHDAVSALFTHVSQIATNRALEETTTSVTTVHREIVDLWKWMRIKKKVDEWQNFRNLFAVHLSGLSEFGADRRTRPVIFF